MCLNWIFFLRKTGYWHKKYIYREKERTKERYWEKRTKDREKNTEKERKKVEREIKIENDIFRKGEREYEKECGCICIYLKERSR